MVAVVVPVARLARQLAAAVALVVVGQVAMLLLARLVLLVLMAAWLAEVVLVL
jgi:hypothetical protein